MHASSGEEKVIKVKRGISPLHIILTAVNAGIIAILVLYAAISTTIVPGVAALYPATAFEVSFGL